MGPHDPPDILIDAGTFHRLKLLLMLCPAEIAGLGYVTPHPKGFLIRDLFVLPQRVTESDAELDPGALASFLGRFVGDGGDPSALQLWWHSHADGDVYWSETDLETIERFPGTRVISIVGNQRGDLLCRLDLFAPRRDCLENLPLVVVHGPGDEPGPDLEAIRRQVRSEIKTMLKQRVPMEPLIDHEGVVGFISEEGYDVEVEPSDGSPAPSCQIASSPCRSSTEEGMVSRPSEEVT
jgi:hypothetical protein